MAIDRPPPLAELMLAAVHPEWRTALAPVEHRIRDIARALESDANELSPFVPAPPDVLRAFSRPLSHVRVLIVGQDPYPTPGHAMGLSFSVDARVRPLPRSLVNIRRELVDDVGVELPAHGDLSRWSDHGVLLLNRVLTVRAGESGSHRGLGWEEVTRTAVRALVDRGAPLVAILWGADAARLAPDLDGVPLVRSAHPSPLSASRGFFGSRPFSRANALLESRGGRPVDWSLDAAVDPRSEAAVGARPDARVGADDDPGSGAPVDPRSR